LIGSVLLLLLTGAVDLGRYWFTEESLRNAVAGAARIALLDATVTGCNPTAFSAATNHPGLRAASLQLCASRATANGVTTVTVTGTYTFSFYAAAFGHGTRTLTDSISFRY
jgi:Flp pilus assembly protein TadG